MTERTRSAGDRRSGTGGSAPAFLVRGDDATLVAQAARELIEELVGEREPSLVVEEHGAAAGEDLDVGAVVDACTTPPFLVDRRVVVVRDAGRLTAGDATRLVAYLAMPLPSTTLVLVGGGGGVPQGLAKAVGAAGGLVDTAVGTGRARQAWLAERLREAPVRLDPAAAKRLGVHLGDDLGRLAGILQTLAAAYGRGAVVGEEELEPYLGEAGSVPPWELTDAIDAGATADALWALRRMLGAGGRSPAEVLATLHRHVSSMLRLDGADVRSAEDAAELLGVRSAFVAKKALAQARRLGTERIGRAVTLLSAADLDVKGRTGLPAELVLEILVARLSRLAGARPSSGRH